MFNRRFLLALSIVSILFISLVISSFGYRTLPSRAEAASDFYQRHPNWTWSIKGETVYHLDCFRRELHLSKPSSLKIDASNYFVNLT
jgi:hypothetical protein